MDSDNPTPNPRHYVFVVHGMGEPKLNETTTPVIQRFAEVRQQGQARKILLPACLSAQSVRKAGMGQGWSEYNGIPVDPGDDTGKFDGSPATDSSGKNFRFVEIYWSDMLQNHQERYASPVEKWSKALLERLETYPGDSVPNWAKVILNTIVDTTLPLKKVVSLKYPELMSLVFDDFLGDVHLYGDYARNRGRSVRRFHRVLDEICVRDFIDWCSVNKEHDYQPPEFTVIAHSLGAIFSFDALVYSHLKEDVRANRAASSHLLSSLPFPGYSFQDHKESETWSYLKEVSDKRIKDISDTKLRNKRKREFKKYLPGFDSNYDIPTIYWRGRIKNFVTMGGPIDKFLILWQKNYSHMDQLDKDDFIATKEKIVHYNLCDEQDPVGHHMNIARNTALYKEVFNTDIPAPYTDAVYRRYAVPGVAHIRYFDDEVLFNGVVKEIIDGWDKHSESAGYTEQKGRGYFISTPFRDTARNIYEKTLVWAYFRLPFILSLLTTVLVMYGLSGLGIFGGQGISNFGINHGLAFIASLLLWIMPKPMAHYVDESKPCHPEEAAGGVCGIKPWRLARGIFANLVMGAVQWRVIVLAINSGLPHTTEQALERNEPLGFNTAGNFQKRLTARVFIAVAMFIAGFLLAWQQDGGVIDSAAKILMLGTTIYTLTMAYVSRCFYNAKKQLGLKGR